MYTYAHVGKVDAVLDAAGKGGLGDAVALAGGPARVITLADEHAAGFGVVLSAPTAEQTPGIPGTRATGRRYRPRPAR